MLYEVITGVGKDQFTALGITALVAEHDAGVAGRGGAVGEEDDLAAAVCAGG